MSYYGPLTSTLRWGTRVQRSGSMGANCASIPISTLLTALPCRSVVWRLYMRQLYICERVWYKNNINTTYTGTLSGGGTNRFLQAITASSFLVGKLWSLTELFRRWSVVVHYKVYKVPRCGRSWLRGRWRLSPAEHGDSCLRSDGLCTSSWCRRGAALIGLAASHGSPLYLIFIPSTSRGAWCSCWPIFRGWFFRQHPRLMSLVLRFIYLNLYILV